MWDLPAHATVHVTIYNFDGASGLRNPFLARPRAWSETGCSSTASPRMPSTRTTHRTRSRSPALGLIVAFRAWPTCQEPVRLRAVLPVTRRASHDQVHVPHDRARPLPLAVLRPLRGGVDLRVRRADADDRLHGRLPQREGLMASEPAAAPRDRAHERRRAGRRRLAHPERDRNAARGDLRRAADPAGQRERPGPGTDLRNQVMTSLITPVLCLMSSSSVMDSSSSTRSETRPCSTGRRCGTTRASSCSGS